MGSQSPVDGPSLWTARNAAPPPSPPLQGVISTEVAIVGAGISGLSTALHLGALGTDAVILEAGQRPAGATAASAGLVAPQLVRTTPVGVLKRLGAERGARLLRLVAEAGRYTFDLIASEQIACAAQPHGFLRPVSGDGGVDQIRLLLEEWAPFRTDLRMAEAAEVRLITGCEGYSAALVDSSGGALDPVAYAQGLAARLSPDRVQLFRGSAVISIQREGSRWSLKTSDGVVLARTVVLCANGGNPGLHPSLAKTVLPLPVYQVATKPLPLSMRRTILPQGHALTDSSTNVFSIRFDIEGRLITAAPAGAPLGLYALSDQINQRLVSVIPSYQTTELDYAWRGTAWLNSNLLPRLVAVDEGFFAIQACNGRGLALTTVVGREMARRLTSTAGYETLVPLEKPRPVRGYSVARHVPGLMMLGASLERAVRNAPARLIGRSPP